MGHRKFDHKRDFRTDMTLRYRNLEGTVTRSHIHFGQPGVAGGVPVFLCSNLGNGPAGGFSELMRAGVTYATVHSTLWPAGEIRGQFDREGQGQDDR